jgi:hypothetical protein
MIDDFEPDDEDASTKWTLWEVLLILGVVLLAFAPSNGKPADPPWTRPCETGDRYPVEGYPGLCLLAPGGNS